MIANSQLRDDLDLVSTHYNPKAGHVAINMPSIDQSYFNSDSSIYYAFDESESVLSMPPQLPENAVIIAAHIFNANNKDKQIEFTFNSDFSNLFYNNYFRTQY